MQRLQMSTGQRGEEAADLKPNAVYKDKFISSAGRKPWKRDTFLKREERSPYYPCGYRQLYRSSQTKQQLHRLRTNSTVNMLVFANSDGTGRAELMFPVAVIARAHPFSHLIPVRAGHWGALERRQCSLSYTANQT